MKKRILLPSAKKAKPYINNKTRKMYNRHISGYHFKRFDMKMYLVLIVLFFVLSAGASAQKWAVNHAATKMVDSAKLAFCENDTLKMIAILERMERLYPTDGLIIGTNKALANLYLAKGRTTEAKAKLLYGISYKPVNYPFFANTDTCSKMLLRHIMPSVKADVCVDLSQIYLNEKKFDSSLYYLDLADNKFLPYKDCGNGVFMYRSYLSPYFANYFLAIGDTAKAMVRLFNYFLKMDGNYKLLTEKLKSLLLQKYSQQEITQQVRSGLKRLKFEDSDDHFYLCITLFGYTIKEYGSGDKKLYRKFYREHPSLKMLSDTQK
jgi:hypothetical protein